MKESNLITVDVTLKGLDILLSGINKTIDDLKVDDLLREIIEITQCLNQASFSEPDQVEALLDRVELFWRVCFHERMQGEIKSCVDTIYRKFLIVKKNRIESINWHDYLNDIFKVQAQDDLNEVMRKLLIREKLEDYSRKWKGGWPYVQHRN